MALSKIQAESMNLADTYAFTGTVSGASDIAFIQQYTWTGVTSFEIARTFDDYEVFKIYMYDVQFTQDDVNMLFDVSSDSGSTYGAYSKRITGIKNNRGASDNNYSNTIYQDTQSGNVNVLFNAGGADTAEASNVEITLYNLNHANRFTNIFFNNSFSRTGNYSEMGLVHLMVLQDVALNALKWTISGSGTFSGTAELFGVKKA